MSDPVKGMTMSAEKRKDGAIAAAHALQMGSMSEADRADAQAIADDAVSTLLFFLPRDTTGMRQKPTPDHIVGAAKFFRELADALDEHAAKARGMR